MASLEEFLKSGKLGALHVWMTREDAVAVLGAAPDESVQKEPKILKYGGLQVTFARLSKTPEQRLVLTGLYFHAPSEKLPDAVLPTDLVVSSETTVAEMRSYLGRLGLEETTSTGGADDRRIELASGASMNFRNDRLWSIQYALRTPESARKQISITVPEETWAQVSQLARQSKRSVSDMCAEWLTERAKELQMSGPNHRQA
jgi:hypothetical protein